VAKALTNAHGNFLAERRAPVVIVTSAAGAVTDSRPNEVPDLSGTDFVAALDIGGTKLAAAIVGGDGGLVSKTVARTEPAGGPEAALGRALDLVEEAWGHAKRAGLKVSALGVATKGITTEHAVHIAGMPGWERLRVPEAVRERFPGTPTAIVNDVRAAALAEVTWGALKGSTTGLYVNLGTGFAVAVVAGGQLLRGAHDAAGEVGYMVPSRQALLNHQPGDAPLEGLIGGRAIPWRTKDRLGAPTTMEGLVALAKTDGAAAQLLAEIADEIAMWVVNVALVIDPERIVIGGGFLRWGPTLFERLEAVAERCMPFAPALVSAHFGTDSALVGAGASALALVGPPGAPDEARVARDDGMSVH